MKRTAVFLLLPALAGCLSASSLKVTQWPLEYRGPVKTTRLPKYEVGRVSQVIVRSPYNETGIAVLRADGSMAFDHYNEYAANPTALLRSVAFDAMDASGLFGAVVNPSSSVRSSALVEVLIGRLAIDCRQPGERKAVASVRVRIVADGERALHAKGEGEADAKGGNYGAALSDALSTALNTAFAQFR